MTRITSPVLAMIAASGLVFAQSQPPMYPPPQQQQPAPNGGWRRVGDPPPAPPVQQDPSEPVDRSDQYGQQPQAYPQVPLPPAPEAQQPPQQQRQPQPQPNYRRPAYGVPPELTLHPGGFVTIFNNQPLSSDHNQQGDTFTGTLAQPIVIDGIVVAQRGQTVYGRVVEARKAKTGESSRLGLQLTSITLADGNQVNVRSQLVARKGGTTPAGVQAGTIVGTTALGAAIGGAADWGRGAAIGAGAGAAAGIIGVLLTRNHETVVYPETQLTFQIESQVNISTERAPQAFRYVGPDEYERGPQLQQRPVGPPQPAGYYGYGYYGPGYAYPYPYWGPSVYVGWGPGYFYGRGYYRRWR